MAFYCYIVASGRNGTLYVGSTDDLTRRIGQHKAGDRRCFTADYGCDQLVWFSIHDSRDAAFQRERRIKEWRRAWKLRMIEGDNPDWRDLYWVAAGVAPPSLVQAVGNAAKPESEEARIVRRLVRQSPNFGPDTTSRPAPNGGPWALSSGGNPQLPSNSDHPGEGRGPGSSPSGEK
jgi:putative endonuclease